MPQPYYYAVDVPDPNEMINSSVNTYRNMMILGQQKQAIRDAEAQKAAELQRAQEQSKYLSELSKNPTVEGIVQAGIKLPHLTKVFTDLAKEYAPEEQRQRMTHASNIHAALLQGKPDQAIRITDNLSEAYDNAGRPKDAAAMRDMGRVIGLNEGNVQVPLGMMLNAWMGSDKYTKTFGDLQKQQPELEKTQAEASKARQEAEYAGQKAAAEVAHLEAQDEIAKQNAKIDAMKAAEAKEQNQLKKSELKLKIDEAEQKKAVAMRESKAQLETSRSQLDNMVNTLDKIGQVGGWTLWRSTGPVADLLPTILASTADFEELVNLAGSQAFVNQAPLLRGFGALTEREGDKLQRSLQNLSLRQSGEQFMESVRESTRLLLKARAFLAERYGVPDTLPDTPSVSPTQEEIDAAYKKYGVR